MKIKQMMQRDLIAICYSIMKEAENVNRYADKWKVKFSSITTRYKFTK